MANNSSALLINEEPLQVIPSLAVAIGLNEAIALQQLHYWLRKSKNVRDGRKWVYNSYAEWSENFPFWSERTIQRAFLELEEKKLITVDTPGGRDRRKWYTINYDAVNSLTSETDTHTLPRPASEPEVVDTEPLPDDLSTRQVGTMHDASLSLSDVPSWHDASCQLGTMEDAVLARPSRQNGTMFKGSENTQENTQENTHTHGPPTASAAAPEPKVCACRKPHGSEFCDDLRLSYARNQPHINNPPGYAQSKDVRDGRDDGMIRDWLAQVAHPAGTPPAYDSSKCPDCKGAGMYYPDGLENGVAKCKHPNLNRAAA